MNYKLIGQRNLRKYTEDGQSPTYAASIEAQNIVNALCDIEWSKTSEKDAIMTYHTEDVVDEVDGKKINGLDMNVLIRDKFDAALFCADHTGGQHRAYANAAVYHYEFPDGTLPKLTKLTASVTSDPYNSMGARISVLTNSTGVIPTNCDECRTGDAHADGVAPRTVAANGNWFPTMADCVFSATPGDGEYALPSGGLQLQKHLFVFVLMESYSTVRGNWLEGCSFIKNLIEIETDAAVPGWLDGSTHDTVDGGTFQIVEMLNDPDKGLNTGYRVIGTMKKCECVYYEGVQVVALYGEQNDDDFGLLPGLKLVSRNSRSGFAIGSVLKAVGSVPDVSVVGRLHSFFAHCYSAGNKIAMAWIDDGHIFNTVTGFEKTDDGYDMTNAKINSYCSLTFEVAMADIQIVWGADSKPKYHATVVDTSGIVHEFILSEDSAGSLSLTTHVVIPNAPIISITSVSSGICVVGEFTSLNYDNTDYAIDRFALLGTGSAPEPIFKDSKSTVYPSPVLDTYTNFRIGPFVVSGSLVEHKTMILGDFRKVNNVTMNGAAFLVYREEAKYYVLPLDLKRFVVPPAMYDSVGSTAARYEYLFSGLAIMN